MIALVGLRSGELLSFAGHVLLHDGPVAEVEYLVTGVRLVDLPGTAEHISSKLGRPVMMLRDHPGLASVRWPLQREDFNV